MAASCPGTAAVISRILRDPEAVAYLNIQFTNELTAINQYFLHACTLWHWALTRFGKSEYSDPIDQ